jgi:signal transduction histidine kinase
VLGHEAVLVQVFDNLIGNALKFVAPGVAPHVRIDGRVDGDTVHVRIADNGIGIPEDKRERVFDVFDRLHGDDGRPGAGAGAGIGLAIVKKGVERLGGTVRVEPAPAGTVFRLCLQRPRQVAAPASAPVDAPPVA